MDAFIYSVAGAFLVSLISFIGLIILIRKISTHSILITGLISFAAGTLIGDVFLHLLPEQIEEYGYTTDTVFMIFFGILLMLVVEAYFHCSHDSETELEHTEHKKRNILAKLNILGDGLHNFLDGIAIGASFLISPGVGIATTFAVMLHEIPQELADTSVLIYAGWTRKKILFINFLTALSSIFGVIVVFFITSIFENAEKFLVPIAIGQFIYIALADLLPEIHKRSGVKKYILEIGMFILGLIIMYLLTLAEIG